MLPGVHSCFWPVLTHASTCRSAAERRVRVAKGKEEKAAKKRTVLQERNQDQTEKKKDNMALQVLCLLPRHDKLPLLSIASASLSISTLAGSEQNCGSPSQGAQLWAGHVLRRDNGRAKGSGAGMSLLLSLSCAN